ncbi:hypothetical protein [Rhodococcus sp. H29-C3]|uniref:hypothetical protein n=1 Tax=Rhodococcus sp. H29-C3 TaxID=3046307 RepID=UPI0024BB9061|nr:hypothetical protein [Rhodococcus sp. H29-C3]MDJ0363212.1 hypothetical protein [Rhodococcus sp. H29-C3]
MNIISARAQRNRARQNLLDNPTDETVDAYKTAEQTYQEQLPILDVLRALLCLIVGGVTFFAGIFDDYTLATVVGLCLIALAMLAAQDFRRTQDRGYERTRDRIAATLSLNAPMR